MDEKERAVDLYFKRKISIGKAAKISDLSVSEMIDLLASLGVKNKIDVMDYKEGLKNLDKFFN